MSLDDVQCGSVAIRAFRGNRRTSVYRDHVFTSAAFRRILEAGRRRGLPVLSSLDRNGPNPLGKQDARRLAAETTNLRRSGELTDLDEDLTGVAEVARWCAHAPDDAWVRIEAA